MMTETEFEFTLTDAQKSALILILADLPRRIPFIAIERSHALSTGRAESIRESELLLIVNAVPDALDLLMVATDDPELTPFIECGRCGLIVSYCRCR